MRPLLLLLAVLLAFLAILKFYPAGEGGDANAAPREAGGFLTRPEAPVIERPSAPVVTPRPEVERPAIVEEAATEPAVGDEANWLDDFEGVALAGNQEIELGAAMVHDRCASVGEQVARLGDALPEDRGRMVVAFGHAFRGNAARAREVARGISGALPVMEERFLRAVLEGGQPPLRPRNAVAHGPVALAMSMLCTERMVEEDLAARGWASAVRGLSDLLLAELDAPWTSSRRMLVDWAARLNEVQDRHRWDQRGVWPSEEIEVLSGDSLSSVLARYRRNHPERGISTGLVALVNGIEDGLIHPGDVLRVPTEEVRARVDLETRMVFVLMGGEVAGAWECAVGAEGQETVPGDYVAGEFQKNPPHWVKGQPMVPFGDPANPLGTRWIAWWDADRTENNLGLGFHGTNAPDTVGQAASKGCVRMHNAEVERLYAILPKWAPIRVD